MMTPLTKKSILRSVFLLSIILKPARVFSSPEECSSTNRLCQVLGIEELDFEDLSPVSGRDTNFLVTERALIDDDQNYKPIDIGGHPYSLERIGSGNVGVALKLSSPDKSAKYNGRVIKLPKDLSPTSLSNFQQELAFESWLKAVDLEKYGTNSDVVDVNIDGVEVQSIVKDYIDGSEFKNMSIRHIKENKAQFAQFLTDLEEATQKEYWDPLEKKHMYGAAHDLHGANLKLDPSGAIRIIDAQFTSCDDRDQCKALFELELHRKKVTQELRWLDIQEVVKECLQVL